MLNAQRSMFNFRVVVLLVLVLVLLLVLDLARDPFRGGGRRRERDESAAR
jgi:hypothetical protein